MQRLWLQSPPWLSLLSRGGRTLEYRSRRPEDSGNRIGRRVGRRRRYGAVLAQHRPAFTAVHSVSHPYWQRFNASLTGLAFGDPPIFRKVPGGALAGAFAYPFAAGYDNDTLRETMAQWGGVAYSGIERPRLMIRALDVEAGAPAWLDSASEPITPSMTAASSATPLLFKPGMHAGKPLWDGDIWTQGVLPQALQRLRAEGGEEAFHVITTELYARLQGMPIGLGGSLHQLRSMQLAARCDQHVDALQLVVPKARVTRIRRAPQPYEQASLGLFDWAPEYIEALLRQGRADAEAALAAPVEAPRANLQPLGERQPRF